MKNLLTVKNFGSVDADTDDLLIECFEDHEAYLNVIDFNKFLIVGRKGSGKTAIFKKILLQSSYDTFSFGHTFSDYPWNYHDKQVKLGIPDYDKYTHSWKYLMLLTISKILLNQDQSIPYDDASLDNLSKIEKFIIDTYGSKDPDVTQIFTPTKQLRLKPHFEIDWNLLKAGISPECVPILELPTIIQEVNSNLIKYVINSLNPQNKYYILFDQLDLGFDPNNKDYNNRLIGLLLAAREINNYAKSLNKKLIVVIFLRDDILDNLHFDDKNKIIQNYLSTIEWDTPRTEKTLMSLMEKRFTNLISDNKAENITWDLVFDSTQKMTGKQSKYQHIIDRTFLRPRDIIKFCNEVLNQFKTRASANFDILSKFDNVDINRSKLEYSNYFLSELDDEVHKHIPYYNDVLEVFKRIGYLQFTLQDFVSEFNQRADLFKDINPKDVLKELFDFSIIGFYRAGGSGYGGSEYVYKYKDRRSQFDEKADKYRIHPGLMEVLQLRRTSRTEIEEQ